MFSPFFSLLLASMIIGQGVAEQPIVKPSPWKHAAGAFGSWSAGNSDFLEIGGKGKSSFEWRRKFKLSTKEELYYWKSHQYDGLKALGQLRFDHTLNEYVGYFALSSARHEEDKKIELELEESGGLSLFLYKSYLIFETRAGYGYKERSNASPVEHSWVAGHSLYTWIPISEWLTWTTDILYTYPAYSSRLKTFFNFKDGWIWIGTRLQASALKNLYFYVEFNDSYVPRPGTGVKAHDLYTRFGFDYWFP